MPEFTRHVDACWPSVLVSSNGLVVELEEPREAWLIATMPLATEGLAAAAAPLVCDWPVAPGTTSSTDEPLVVWWAPGKYLLLGVGASRLAQRLCGGGSPARQTFDLSSSFAILHMSGPRAAAALTAGARLPRGAIAPGRAARCLWGPFQVLVLPSQARPGAIRILVDRSLQEPLIDSLAWHAGCGH